MPSIVDPTGGGQTPDAELARDQLVEEILDVLPMDSWGHFISCDLDDNECDCLALRERLHRVIQRWEAS